MNYKSEAPIYLLLAFVLILFVVVMLGCEKQPVTNVYSQNTPPQQQCQTLTITGIGDCIRHPQCPQPGYMCQTVINNSNMIYACNPVLYQTQQVCR